MRFLLVALLCTCAAACSKSTVCSEREARRLLTDRTWLDVMPRDKDDRLHVYRFITTMGAGIYQDRTVFAGDFELFTFEPHDDQIRFGFPHTGQTKQTAYRIERLRNGEHGDFDLRLTLQASPRGPAVYYGWSDEHRDREAAALAPMPIF